MTRSLRPGEIDPDLALKGYFRELDWTFKTGLGGMINAAAMILLIVHPLTLPVVLALLSLTCGYLLRVIRYKVLNREGKLPEWDDWLELFMSGLTWLAVQFGLSLVQITALTLSFMIAAAAGTIKMTNVGFFPWAVSTLLAVTFISVAMSLLTPYLMVNYALEEKAAAGFAFRKVIRKFAGNKKNFFLAWLLSVGVMWAAWILPTVTVIGAFLIPSCVFIAHVVCATLYAQAWGADDS